MITLNQYKQDVIAQETSGSMNNITDAQFVSLLNRAIVNKHAELERDCPDVYTKNSTLVFSSQSYEIELPSDMDKSGITTFLLYGTSSRTSVIPSGLYRVLQGKIRFLGEQEVGATYYIEYRKSPNQYSTTTDLSLQDFEESSSIRAKYYLADEIRKLWWDGLNNSEPSSAGNNQIINSNRIS